MALNLNKHQNVPMLKASPMFLFLPLNNFFDILTRRLPATSILVVGGVFQFATTSILVVVITIFLNLLKCTGCKDNQICPHIGSVKALT